MSYNINIFSTPAIVPVDIMLQVLTSSDSSPASVSGCNQVLNS